MRHGFIDGWKYNNRFDRERGHAVESNPKACLVYILTQLRHCLQAAGGVWLHGEADTAKQH
jgi:hypothetical protein